MSGLREADYRMVAMVFGLDVRELPAVAYRAEQRILNDPVSYNPNAYGRPHPKVVRKKNSKDKRAKNLPNKKKKNDGRKPCEPGCQCGKHFKSESHKRHISEGQKARWDREHEREYSL